MPSINVIFGFIEHTPAVQTESRDAHLNCFQSKHVDPLHEKAWIVLHTQVNIQRKIQFSSFTSFLRNINSVIRLCRSSHVFWQMRLFTGKLPLVEQMGSNSFSYVLLIGCQCFIIITLKVISTILSATVVIITVVLWTPLSTWVEKMLKTIFLKLS